MTELTARDEIILALLQRGLSRSEVARQRKTSVPHISQVAKKLKGLGFYIPDPKPKPSPRRDQAFALFRVGRNTTEVSRELGISLSRASFLRGEWVQRTQAAAARLMGVA